MLRSSIHTCIAPSWSWASVGTQVHWGLGLGRGHGQSLASVLGVSTTPEGGDPTGPVTHGRLSLSGHLRPATRRKTNKMGSSDYQNHESYDDNSLYDEHGIRSTEGSFLLPMELGKSEQYIDTSGEWKQIIGLILERHAENPTTYKRVGVFRHSWSQNGIGDTCTECPEFLNFDPDDFERTEIIIV